MSSARLVENNSKKLGLKRSRLFWVFFITAMVLLAPTVVAAFLSTQWVTYPESGEFTQVYAERLGSTPQSYLSLNHPNPYLLEAVSEPGKFVVFRSSDDTRIIEEQLGGNYTNYVEFEGNYYLVYLSGGYVDFPAPYSRGIPFLILLAIAWLVYGIIAAAVYLIRSDHSARKIT